MTTTNKFNLPQPIVRLMERQTYSRGRAHISITELINAPRIVALRRAHRHEMVEDVADRFWAIMGTNIHKILEGAADEEHIPEERLFIEVRGWLVSGGIDLQHHTDGSAAITDWKFTSVWNVMNPKIEWEQQLNMYAHLVETVKGVPVTEATVVAMLRDWKRSDGKRINNYPPAPVAQCPQPLWSVAQRRAYIEERVALHQQAMRTFDWEDKLPGCSADERWVRKNGGAGIRCQEDYCGVSAFCSQWRDELKARAEEPPVAKRKRTAKPVPA